MNQQFNVEVGTRPRDTEIAAIMEEYRALRAEVTPTVDRQYAVMYWGISAVAVLLAAMIDSSQQLGKLPSLVLLLLYILVPGLCTGFVLTWSHIIIKLVRLGSHLYVIEEKIAAIIEGQDFDRNRPDLMPMCWEHFVNEPGAYGYKKTSHLVRWSVAATFAICQGAAVLLSFRFCRGGLLPITPRQLVIITAVLIGTCWCGWFMLFHWISEQIELAMSHRDSFAAAIRKVSSA